MEKLMGFVGATVGSLAGWYLGDLVGFMTAALLSIVGTAVGLWGGRRLARQWLES
ncbi:glycine zipper domain-containing protein [Geothrix sp. PMB-07]|uniref:glycine zipper domain-containing protein n=1 Tax=Geothrix sp. PMB-07 TaxID=3068640 RepID=UPI002740FF1C|nr:hypothetical protein [Geothrix sp. PMB-07]WLT30013.1 hypothetical protein Q9293_09825 [Geothrix sp. PMB-07]